MGSQGPNPGKEKTKKWQMSRHPADKRRYNEATRKLKDHIKRIKEKTFETYFQSSTATGDGDYSL